MKLSIGCFFDGYYPYHETKDPGQIVLGFIDIGVQAELITLAKPELEQYNAPFPIKLITREQACNVSYWRTVGYDAILTYNWWYRCYFPFIFAMKKAGKLVLLKGDTDGRLCFPLIHRSFYHKSNIGWKRWIKNGIRHCPDFLRHIILKAIGRQKSTYLAELFEQTDGIVVETPQAQANLSHIMLFWNKPDVIKKNFTVPNPVANDMINSSVPTKQKQIVAVGRWEDVWQKNTVTMINVLSRFVQMRSEYEIVIIGTGEDVIQKQIAKNLSQKQIRLSIKGHLPHDEIVEHMGRSQILFMPSNWEGFSITAAESVCMGCTIVGSPLESLRFLTQGGFSGTLAPDFTEDELLGALITDTLIWENGSYVPEDISNFWRSKLHRRVLAESFLHLVEQVRVAYSPKTD